MNNNEKQLLVLGTLTIAALVLTNLLSGCSDSQPTYDRPAEYEVAISTAGAYEAVDQPEAAEGSYSTGQGKYCESVLTEVKSNLAALSGTTSTQIYTDLSAHLDAVQAALLEVNTTSTDYEAMFWDQEGKIRFTSGDSSYPEPEEITAATELITTAIVAYQGALKSLMKYLKKNDRFVHGSKKNRKRAMVAAGCTRRQAQALLDHEDFPDVVYAAVTKIIDDDYLGSSVTLAEEVGKLVGT